MARKLLEIYEMARPAGSMSMSMKAALKRARDSGGEFTARDFMQWLGDVGSAPTSPQSTNGQLMRLVQEPGKRPDAYRPLVLTRAGHRGIGGQAIFKYAFDGDPGVQSKRERDAAELYGGEGGQGAPQIRLPGSMKSSDKPYFDRRADIERQAAAKGAPGENELRAANDRLEKIIGDREMDRLRAHIQRLPNLSFATDWAVKHVDPKIQKDVMTLIAAMKGGGRAAGVPVGPPSRRPGPPPPPGAKRHDEPEEEPASDEPSSKSDFDDIDLDDMELGAAGAAKGPPPTPKPRQPEPDDDADIESPPADDEEEPEELEPDEDEDEYEEEPEEEGGQELPIWMPFPDHTGSSAEAAMARLEEAGVSPTDPVWKEIAGAADGEKAHAIIRKSSIPRNMGASAIMVAKHILQMHNREWDPDDKKERWARSVGRVLRG